MRIVHLRASNFYGGPERQLHFHARLALGSPHSITVASFSTAGQRPEFLDVIGDDGVNTHVFEAASSYDFSVVRQIRDTLLRERFDILCTHDYRSALLGGWAARGTKTRWIAFSRGFTSDDLKVRLYHGIDKIIVRFADHIVAVSASQKRKLERLQIPGRKISVVPNAIDVDFFSRIEPVDLRARMGFEHDAIVVVSGGRFSREKGQIHLVRAAGLAAREVPRLRFVLFGDGPDLEPIRKAVAAAGLEGIVRCPGFERGLLQCIRGADILVNPSLSEGLPNIVLEGMALGVPIVATNVGGLPEIIEDGRTGRLVAPSRPNALAAAITEIARDRDLGQSMASAARAFVMSACTFDRQFEQLVAVYENEGRV